MVRVLDVLQGFNQQTRTNALPGRITAHEQFADLMAVNLDETLQAIGVRQPQAARGDGRAVCLRRATIEPHCILLRAVIGVAQVFDRVLMHGEDALGVFLGGCADQNFFHSLEFACVASEPRLYS